jgi:hypothetical protein
MCSIISMVTNVWMIEFAGFIVHTQAVKLFLI